jgi:2-C-methyl-D-erythritol 4-phosphate cytidylyltransferase
MAISDGFNNIIDSATLMHYYGHTLYTVHGKFENIKITTPSDYYIFKALLEAKENSQIFGI